MKLRAVLDSCKLYQRVDTTFFHPLRTEEKPDRLSADQRTVSPITKVTHRARKAPAANPPSSRRSCMSPSHGESNNTAFIIFIYHAHSSSHPHLHTHSKMIKKSVSNTMGKLKQNSSSAFSFFFLKKQQLFV